MVPVRFRSSFLSLLLLSVLFNDPFAHSQQEPVTASDRNWLAPVGKVSTSIHKKVQNGGDEAGLRDSWIKGRKVLRKEMMKKGAERDSSEISGKGEKASEKSFGTSRPNTYIQRGSNVLKPKTPNNMKTTEKSSHETEDQLNIHGVSFQVAKATSVDSFPSSNPEESVSQESYAVDRTVKSQKWLDDAIETMKLLNMDYKKPRRKSPISNGHPATVEDAKP